MDFVPMNELAMLAVYSANKEKSTTINYGTTPTTGFDKLTDGVRDRSSYPLQPQTTTKLVGTGATSDKGAPKSYSELLAEYTRSLTSLYQNINPDEVSWYERRLWGVYDVPAYVRNLFNLPVVAYSGEKDKQIQAARVMEQAFADEGKELSHLIGPGMGHRYHADTLKTILGRMKEACDQGLDHSPSRVTLQTQTLRYHRVHWVDVQRLRLDGDKQPTIGLQPHCLDVFRWPANQRTL